MALTKEQVEAAHAWADKYIQDKNTELHQKLAEPPIGIMPLKGGLADQLVYNPIIIEEKEFMEDLSKSREAAPDKSNYCCDYDTCIALQKLGCPMAKLGYIGLSLYSAQRWLREEKKLFVEITIFEYTYGYRILDTQNVYYDNEHVVRREGCLVGSYEEALLEGIKECIKLLQHGNN